MRERLLEPAELVVRQRHVDGCRVLLEIRAPLRPRDRHDVLAARQHPRERDLPRRAALLPSDRVDDRDEIEVLLEIVAAEAWMPLAKVVLLDVVRRRESTGEHPAAEWRVRDEADAPLAHGLQPAARLRVPRP